MMKLTRTERLSGDKYNEARSANKAILEQCQSYDELFEALMTTTKDTMRKTTMDAVEGGLLLTCGTSPLFSITKCSKEGAAKICAEEILRPRRIRAFKALGHAERLEAMRTSNNSERHAYVNSLTTEELSEYVAELYAGHEEEIRKHCDYQGKRFGLLQLLNGWLNKHLFDRPMETTAEVEQK